MTSARRMRAARLALLLHACPLLAACGADPSQTTLRITAFGEGFIEDRIPADVLVDGWTIDFSRFLIAIDEVEAEGEPLAGTFVVDLARASMGEGHELGQVRVPAVEHPHLDYRIAPVDVATPVVTTPVAATDEDVARLVDAGASMWVEGEATKDGQVMAFAWAFTTDTRYVDCHGIAELPDGGAADSQITIHADHLFYDDLDSEEPNVSFDLVASADADGDGEVTADELRAVDITGEARYQVGSRDVTDLWRFIEVQTSTVGHIDGEGHCERSP